jgi:hypothetical protein
MEDSVKLQELKDLLLLYNLVNTITSPTRITKKSFTLIDTIVINKQYFECSSNVLDLGYSDHLAQIININVNRSKRGTVKIRKRQFSKESIDEFTYLLQKETWQKCFLNLDVNTSFNAFMDLIFYYYNIVFTLKTVSRSNIEKKKMDYLRNT